MSEQRPPWLVIAVLPDEVPPVAADLSSLPSGTKVLAMCSELAEETLVRIGYVLARDQVAEIEQKGLDVDNGTQG